MNRTKSLSELAAEAIMPKRKVWIDKIDLKVREELEELKGNFQQGKYSHLSCTFIYKTIVCKRYGKICTESTFRKWIMHDEKEEQKQPQSKSTTGSRRTRAERKD